MNDLLSVIAIVILFFLFYGEPDNFDKINAVLDKHYIEVMNE